MEKNLKKNTHTHTHTMNHFDVYEKNNIVNKLYFNKTQEKCTKAWTLRDSCFKSLGGRSGSKVFFL